MMSRPFEHPHDRGTAAGRVRAAAAAWLAIGLCLSVVAATPLPRGSTRARAHARDAGAWHLHLLRSAPAAGDTLRASPTAVRLWFSEPPELAITTVRLTAAAGGAVALAPVTRGTGSDAPVEAALRARMPAGSYTVFWRTTARDGHPATGRYQFVIAPAATPPGATPGR
jgi:copper resistance protein C